MILIKTFSPIGLLKLDIHQPFLTAYTYYYAFYTTMCCIVLLNPLYLYCQSETNYLLKKTKQ
jgi:hypothetical protein